MDSYKARKICVKFTERLDLFRKYGNRSAYSQKITYKDIASAVGYNERGGEMVGRMFNGKETPFWARTVRMIAYLRTHMPYLSVDALLDDTDCEMEFEKMDFPISAGTRTLSLKQTAALHYLLRIGEFAEFLEHLGGVIDANPFANAEEIPHLDHGIIRRAVARSRPDPTKGR